MKKLLLAGGSVFDARSGQVAEADVVVAGERIVAVGRCLDADEAVDCSDALLVPGFIDCHTHLRMAETDPFDLPRSARPLSAVPVLATLLRRGVTTVRDAWGADAGVRLAVHALVDEATRQGGRGVMVHAHMAPAPSRQRHERAHAAWSTARTWTRTRPPPWPKPAPGWCRPCRSPRATRPPPHPGYRRHIARP